METREAKQFLGQIRRIDQRIAALRQRKERLYDAACKTTTHPSLVYYGGSTDRSGVEDNTILAIALQEDIDRQIEAIIRAQREVTAGIESIDDDRIRDVLTWRYANGRHWEEIAYALNYERRHVLRLHGRGLIEIQRYLNSKK